MTVYVGPGPDNSVSISPVSQDDPGYESSHVIVLDAFDPKRTTQGALTATLINLLRLGGADVVHEA